MTCNLPASLLNIDMMADGPGKSARDFGATRAFFQKQGGQARQVPPCLKRTLMEQKYSQTAWDAKMEDKVGDFKERGQRVLDMRHCVRKLKDIRLLAANYKLSDFSDFWADDYMKKKPGMLRAVEGDTLFRRFRRSGDKGDLNCSNGRGTQPGHYGEESRKKNELLQYPPNVHKQKV